MSGRFLSRGVAAMALLALAACQSLPQVIVTGQDTFDVRYDASAMNAAEVDARASGQCATPPHLVNSGTRYDGFAFRSYRCQRRH